MALPRAPQVLASGVSCSEHLITCSFSPSLPSLPPCACPLSLSAAFSIFLSGSFSHGVLALQAQVGTKLPLSFGSSLGGGRGGRSLEKDEETGEAKEGGPKWTLLASASVSPGNPGRDGVGEPLAVGSLNHLHWVWAGLGTGGDVL